MIDNIKKSELSNYIEDTCCENDICVNLDNIEDYIIIKVDKYYNSLNIAERPPSIDCLIINKCKDNNTYAATLVELKNTNKFDLENLIGKFETTLTHFMSEKFSELLYVDYKKIQLYYVSTKELYKRDVSLKLEALMNVKFNYNNKKLMIRPQMPDPAIKNCY